MTLSEVLRELWEWLNPLPESVTSIVDYEKSLPPKITFTREITSSTDGHYTWITYKPVFKEKVGGRTTITWVKTGEGYLKGDDAMNEVLESMKEYK